MEKIAGDGEGGNAEDRAERDEAERIVRHLFGRGLADCTPEEVRLAHYAARVERRAHDVERALLGELEAAQCFG